MFDFNLLLVIFFLAINAGENFGQNLTKKIVDKLRFNVAYPTIFLFPVHYCIHIHPCCPLYCGPIS